MWACAGWAGCAGARGRHALTQAGDLAPHHPGSACRSSGPDSLAGPMSTTAASHLSPAYPLRAPWGTASALRAWQQEALDVYLRDHPRDFLAVATPGAGKTAFALRVATELLDAKIVQAVTVVAPTEHLKHQWADAASKVGITLDPT